MLKLSDLEDRNRRRIAYAMGALCAVRGGVSTYQANIDSGLPIALGLGGAVGLAGGYLVMRIARWWLLHRLGRPILNGTLID